MLKLQSEKVEKREQNVWGGNKISSRGHLSHEQKPNKSRGQKLYTCSLNLRVSCARKSGRFQRQKLSQKTAQRSLLRDKLRGREFDSREREGPCAG
jgi:hypothetical protein